MVGISKKTSSYISLFFVVFVWGCSPLITLEFYKYYSPTIRLCFSEFILLITYIVIAGKNIKDFDLSYIKVGVPTGLFLALANITQKIGLLYTTPTRYAFLENLSCITVPILMYILIKKKPTVTMVIATITCLISAFILNGISFSDSSWGIGEILCAASGLLYGFNIAGTGAFVRKLNASLYLATQAFIGFSISLIFSLILNFTTYVTASGIREPIEKITFSFEPMHIFFLVIFTVFTSAFCWIIRTNAMKHVDAVVVTIIMPFSSVITGILSVLSGKDTLNLNLVLGAVLGVLAVILSGLDDIKKTHLKKTSGKSAS